MKTAAPLAILALAGLSAAQKPKLLESVPECARECLGNAVRDGTDCDIDDSDCICIPDNYYSIYDIGSNCVILACGAAKSVEEVLPQGQQFCADVTGGSAEVTVTDTDLPTATPAPSASQTQGNSTTAASSTPSADAGEEGDDDDSAASTLAHIGGIGILALGVLAAF